MYSRLSFLLGCVELGLRSDAKWKMIQWSFELLFGLVSSPCSNERRAANAFADAVIKATSRSPPPPDAEEPRKANCKPTNHNKPIQNNKKSQHSIQSIHDMDHLTWRESAWSDSLFWIAGCWSSDPVGRGLHRVDHGQGLNDLTLLKWFVGGQRKITRLGLLDEFGDIELW